MEVDWIILADSAEVISNKLYVLGGGWDALTVNTEFPVKHACAIAVAFCVPWDETNQRHHVAIEVLDVGDRVLSKVAAQIEVGRPRGLPVGQAQRVQVTTHVEPIFARPGDYSVVARVEGEEVRRVQFSVVAGHMIE